MTEDEQYKMAEAEDTDELPSEYTLANPGVRFRVLILGRANAGKTTILERLCESTIEQAEVYQNGSPTGRRMQKGERGRGEHDIEDETIFPSLPGFVFHDSRGIESGSENEVVTIEAFVKRRSQSVKNKSEQLHAIWICLPLDDDRPLVQAEENLFRIDSGDVPVIVIFTKRDARYTKCLNEELGNSAGHSKREMMKKAKAAAEERVEK
ncbi:hypothetical protein OF83DRAFT_1169191 [Amylostereum chailletii]|nr:hypothetical protein OF83DRAFT_1169191 [Amylostereum chailletii]